MKHILSLTLRCGIGGVCIAYLLWGTDLRALGAGLLSYPPGLVALSSLVGLLLFIVQGLRFRCICAGRAGLWGSTVSCLFAAGLNNIFPARLGELGKAFYLKRRHGIALREAMSFIIWERVFDMSCLLGLALLAGMLSGRELVWIPLAMVVCGLWLCIAASALFPRAPRAVLQRVPLRPLRSLLEDMLAHLVGQASPGRLAAMALHSLLVWTALPAAFGFLLLTVAGLNVTPAATLVAFVISSLGMCLPGTPGGLGVFEAALVFSLGWYGVDKETALSVAVLWRVTQTLPATVIAAMMLGGDLSISAIRGSMALQREQ